MNPTAEQREEREFQADLRTSPEQEGAPADQTGEQESENLGDLSPRADFDILPVVGLGGSAGGISALQEFFGAMTSDSGSAFVVVMHLAPDSESQLHRVIQHHTRMPVVAVTGQTKVEANHVYVIPAGHHLAMEDGHLHLEPLENEFGKRVAVDLFFRTLAASHRSRAVAVVLSGMDSDGAVGIRRIKEMGGVTVVQALEEAEYEGMPRAAINTGMVDWVLPVAQIAARLADFARNEERIQVAIAQVADREPEEKEGALSDEAALREILSYLYTRTRRDFAHYKRATVLRRIMRRLQVNALSNLPDYLHFLRSHAGEAGALLQDLLISVTNFFRDPEAFAALESHIPALFRNKQAGDTVRVWVSGCATGEEAYSLAMLLVEYADTLAQPPSIQVFATDIDEEALRVARDGRYPQAIAADVSPERLRRFFVLGHGMFRVRLDVRDLVLFAVHNLLGDAPFSRMDLISCRNLLIYFEREAQEKALGVFHFSLQPEGTLFLGGSESPDGIELFAPLDKKHRLYSRRSLPRASVPIPAFSPPPPLESPNLREFLSAVSLPQLPPTASPAPDTASFGELHLQMLELLAPPSVLVNAEYDILHLSPEAGRFLVFAGGSATTNLLSVAQPSLRLELRAALFRCLQSGEDVRVRGLTARIEGAMRLVDVRVRPLREPGRSDGAIYYLLVVFEERSDEAAPAPAGPGERDDVAHRLNLELNQMKAVLRQTIEQYEAATEELKASNEELQAVNEELRSAGEELETSREELQATNEELLTVNAETKGKVEQISQSNADLNNLIASTDIATVFLDRQLCVKRYTPRALDLFRLEPTDLGRHLSDLRNSLELDDEAYIEDAERVLDQLLTVEREVKTRDGRVYLLRVSPYRTQDNRIDGVVLAFVDISLRKQAEDLLRASEERARALISNLPGGAAFIVDENERYILAEGEALEAAGMQPSDFVGRTLGETAPPASLDEFRRLYRSALRGDTFEMEHQVGGHWYLTRGVPLRDSEGVVAALAVSYDITRRKATEEALREREERLRLVMESVTEYAIITLDQSGAITGWNPGAERTFGWTRQEAIGQNTDIIFTPEDRQKNEPDKEQRDARELGSAIDERWHVRKDGSRLFMSGILSPLRNGDLHGFVKIARDLTREREREAALRESEAQFRTLSDAVPQIIWTNEAGGVANYFNSRWFEYSGLSLEDSFGPGWQAIVHPDDAPASKERWQRALDRGEVFDAEYRLRRHDGQHRWFIGRNVPLRDGSGQVTGWFGTATDINDLKEAEDALRENSERFRAMFEQGTAGVAEYDLDGNHIFVNETLCQSVGYSADELLALNSEDIVYPDDWPRCQSCFEQAKIEEGAVTMEKRLICKSGDIIWVRDSASAIRDENGRTRGVVAVIIDITERKLAEEELRRAHGELEVRVSRRTSELALALERVSAEVEQRRQAEAGRAELMKRIVNTQEDERGRISRELHDNLGQHLTAVMLGLQALETQLEALTSGRRSQSAPQLDKLRELVDGLMRAAHRQAWELRPAELDAMGLESALGQYSRDWSGSTGIEVDFQATGWNRRPAPEVETTLYRVVQEALTNVVRHANATLVSVVIERNDNTASVIIEDNGHGFDTEQSTGRLGVLGMQERLSIVNGTLDIESIPGEGTTVFARVPLQPNAAEETTL